jgi:hypothetical protein
MAVGTTEENIVLRTSSEKLRRAACRELYEQGRVGAHRHAAWWQVIRLAAGWLAPELRRIAFAAGQVLHGVYGWLIFALLARRLNRLANPRSGKLSMSEPRTPGAPPARRGICEVAAHRLSSGLAQPEAR